MTDLISREKAVASLALLRKPLPKPTLGNAAQRVWAVAFNEALDEAIAALPAEPIPTSSVGVEPVAWRRMNKNRTASTGVTDVELFADQWSKADIVEPLYPADAIISLTRRVEAAERERDEARKKAGKLHDYANMRDVQVTELVARAEAAEARVAELTAALGQFKCGECYGSGVGRGYEQCRACDGTGHHPAARAALRQGGSGE